MPTCGRIHLLCGATLLDIDGSVGATEPSRGTFSEYLTTELSGTGNIIGYMPAHREMYFWELTAALSETDYGTLMGIWEWTKARVALGLSPAISLYDYQDPIVEVSPRTRAIAPDSLPQTSFVVNGGNYLSYYAQFAVLFGKPPDLVGFGQGVRPVRLFFVEDTAKIPA